ncbi:RHS repeat domain-containing protein, partial [Mesorhizobium sp. M0052]
MRQTKRKSESIHGNVVSENRTISSIQYAAGYGYDLDKNLTQITYPSGLLVSYQRDAQGRVVGITSKLNVTASTVTLASGGQYLPFGSMNALAQGNGVQMTYSYDQDYRLTRIQAGAAQDLTIGYDAASHIASLTDGVTPSLTQTFQYDLVGRVTNGVGTYGNDSYTYDAAGNRLTRSLVNGGATSTTYTYTSTNTQLAQAVTGSTTLKYAYDANGALLSRKLGNTT